MSADPPASPHDLSSRLPEAFRSALVQTGLAAPEAPCTMHPAPDLTARGRTGHLSRVFSEATAPPGAVPIALVKETPRGPHRERAERERWCLATLPPFLEATPPLRMPALLAADETGDGALRLLLPWLPGRSRSIGDGCTTDDAAQVLAALASMHRAWRAPARQALLSPLPVWGDGERGAARPHQRRADRFRGRLPRFLARYAHAMPPGLADRLVRLADRFEGLLSIADRWPRTLVHGDVHLENLLLPDGRAQPVALLDWQSASRGSGLVDAVRFLVESLHDGGAAPPRLSPLLCAWAEDAEEPGGAAGALDRADAAIDLVLAGFVSGYAGPQTAPPPPPDPVLERLLGADRMGALVP
ncbi:MAG: phosphotransferase [Phycisphaeraceae bacterium]|nr:phosphotransferase [Phycisphaeraceae bacterium]